MVTAYKFLIIVIRIQIQSLCLKSRKQIGVWGGVSNGEPFRRFLEWPARDCDSLKHSVHSMKRREMSIKLHDTWNLLVVSKSKGLWISICFILLLCIQDRGCILKKRLMNFSAHYPQCGLCEIDLSCLPSHITPRICGEEQTSLTSHTHTNVRQPTSNRPYLT